MRPSPMHALTMTVVLAAGSLPAQQGIETYAKLVSSDAALVAYWHFEGDLKDSVGKLPGEACGGDTAFERGPGGGKALVLGGGRYLTAGKTPELDLGETTVELWFQPRFETVIPYNPCIVAKRKGSPETRFSVHVMSSYSRIAVWNGKQVMLFESPLGDLRRGEWYYLAVTSTKEGTKLYLDGLACDPADLSATFTFEAKELPFQVGSSAPEGAELFDGAVDEVAIYSRALVPREIERHMDAMGAKKRVSAEELAAEKERRRIEVDSAATARLAPFMSKEALFERGKETDYRGEHLGAVRLPVGGIGAGSIQIDGRATRPVWQIFGNMSQASIPHSFFAVRVKRPVASRPSDLEAGETVVRALQTVAEGPFAPVKELSFRGEYPFGHFAFEDPDLPIKVSLETFNPLVPTDLRRSGIPCAIYVVTAMNPGEAPVEVNVLAAQQNAVGYRSAQIQGTVSPDYGGNLNRVLRESWGTAVHMSVPGEKGEGKPGGEGKGKPGDMVLAVRKDPQTDSAVTGLASWKSLEELHAAFEKDGAPRGPESAGPSGPGQTLDAAIALSVRLGPRETRKLVFLLTWYFPGTPYGEGGWGGQGNMYENWWSDALDVARDVATSFSELSDLSHRFHDALYATNLPRWLLDRISSQVVVIRSPTCFWTRSGYFGGWEGCGAGGGCCMGNCNHVWQYAQAHARLFPALGRILREQAFGFQAPDGAIPHRQPSSFPAFDGQCGDILGAYREHLLSTDGAWLSRNWASVKKAMDYTIGRWDKDEDGVLAGPQWNTLDGDLGGSSSWLGTMYLAALAASERMALIQGDTASAPRYARICESGSRKQDATLFNGEYYFQIPDPAPQQDYGTGCHIDQVLGQWWAHQLGLGWLYPPQRVRAALRSLYRYNFRLHFHGVEQLPRRFVIDDDPGMQMITWPKGGRPAGHTMYASEVMSGFEYSAAGAMIQAGLMEEAFTVLRGASIRYDGRLRTGVDAGAAWGWSGNPFCDDECGKFYARPMSIWSVLLACQGSSLDGPAGLIGFKPPWKPENHVSFFTAPEGWGVFSQTQDGSSQTDRIETRYGRLRVRRLLLELPEVSRAGIKSVQVKIGGEIPSAYEVSGQELRVTLEHPEVLTAERILTVTTTWKR